MIRIYLKLIIMKRLNAVKKQKLPRKYDNSSRENKSNTNRQIIIENYIELLVTRRGQEISLEELAQKSNLSSRTLFRFFGDKKTLTVEIENYIAQYLSAASTNLEKMSFDDFAAYVFELFDKNENLILAYLYTNFGQNSRVLFRKRFLSLLVEKFKSQYGPIVSPEDTRKMLFVVSLLNANLWSDLRDGFELSGKDMAQTIRWAIQSLTKDLKKI